MIFVFVTRDGRPTAYTRTFAVEADTQEAAVQMLIDNEKTVVLYEALVLTSKGVILEVQKDMHQVVVQETHRQCESVDHAQTGARCSQKRFHEGGHGIR